MSESVELSASLLPNDCLLNPDEDESYSLHASLMGAERPRRRSSGAVVRQMESGVSAGSQARDVAAAGSGETEPRSKQWRMLVGAVVIVVGIVAVVVATNYSWSGDSSSSSPSSSSASAAKDDGKTSALFATLKQAHVDGGHVVLDAALVGESNMVLIERALGATGVGAMAVQVDELALERADVSEQKRELIHLAGSHTEHAVHSFLHYHAGQLHMLMHLRPKNHAASVSLRSVMPDVLSADFDKVTVRDTGLMVSSHHQPLPRLSEWPLTDAKHHVPKGLSVLALADMDSSSHPALDLLRSLRPAPAAPVDVPTPSPFAAFFATSDEFASRVVVAGTVSPSVQLSAVSWSGDNFQVGPYVRLQNVTVEIGVEHGSAKVTATMIVSPPDADKLVVDLQGTTNVDTKQATLEGTQQGAWQLPGDRLEGLTLSLAHAKVHLDYTSDMRITGDVSAKVSYAGTSGYARFALPPPTLAADKGFAVEVLLDRTFQLKNMPAVADAAAFPNAAVLKAALVCSSAAGTYKFTGDATDAPVAQYDVVRGVTLIAQLDLTAADSALSGVAAASDTNHVLVAGTVTTQGAFDLTADVTSLRVSDSFTINSAHLEIASSTPYLQLAAAVQVPGHVFGADDTASVTFNVKGLVSKSQLSLQGDAQTTGNVWTLPLGGTTVQVTQLSADLDIALPASKTAGAHASVTHAEFSGSATIDSTHHVQLNVQYPNVDGHRCVGLVLTDVPDDNAVNLANLLLPAEQHTSRSEFANVATGVLDSLLDVSLENAELRFSPKCGNVSITAAVNTAVFGEADLAVYLDRKCTFGDAGEPQCSGKWHFHVAAAPLSTWKFDSSVFAQHRPDAPKLQLREPVFVLSADDKHLTIPLHLRRGNVTIDIDAKKGLDISAQLVLSGSPDVHAVVAQLDPHATEVDLTGHFDQLDWSFDAHLAASSHVSLSSHVQLVSAFVSVDSKSGVSLKGEIDADLPGIDVSSSSREDGTVAFTVAGEYDKTKHQIHFHGEAAEKDASLSVAVGHSGVSIHSLALDTVVQWHTASGQPPAALHASLSGSVNIRSATLGASLDLMNGVGKGAHGVGFTIELTLTNNQLSVEALAGWAAGDNVVSTLPVPPSVPAATWTFDSLSLTVTNTPEVSFSGQGRMTLFGDSNLAAFVQLSRHAKAKAAALVPDPKMEPWREVSEQVVAGLTEAQTADWQVLVGVELAIHKFSTLIPSVKSLDKMPLASMACAFSTSTSSQPLSFPGEPTPLQVAYGFNFFATLSLTGDDQADTKSHKALQAIRRWTGAETAQLRAAFADESHFNVHADVHGDLDLFHDRVDVDAVGLLLEVTADDIRVGVQSTLEVSLSHRPQDTLHFTDKAFAGDLGFGFDAALTQDWVNPLGIQGVRIGKTALDLELSYEFVPDEFGITGGLHIGGVGGSAAVFLSTSAAVLSAQLDDIHLSDIVDHMLNAVGVHSPPHLVDVITNVGFKKVLLRANTGSAPVSIGNSTFPAGYIFEVDDLNLWNFIRGSALVEMQTSGSLTLDATLQPIHLLGGLIKLGGAEHADNPAKMLLRLSKSTPMPTVNISAGMHLFGQYLDASVTLDDSAMNIFVDMGLFGSLFEWSFNCTSQGSPSSPTDFAMMTHASNKLQDWVAEHVPDKAHETSSGIQEHLEEAKNNLRQKKADLDDIKERIAEYHAHDEQHLSKLEQKFKDASLDLQRKKAHVDELMNKIHALQDKIHHLKWYEKWKAVGYGAEIAALWTAKEVADAALVLARKAVDLARAAIEHVPDVDPRILALEAELGVKRAAYDAAIATLSAVQDVVGGVADIVSGIARWQGRVFNIEEFSMSGSLKDLHNGKLVTLAVRGYFLDRHVDISVEVDASLVDSLVNGCWKDILDIFKHKESQALTFAAVSEL